MIYQQLFECYGGGKIVRAGVIGTGSYATAVITQAQVIPLLDVPVFTQYSGDERPDSQQPQHKALICRHTICAGSRCPFQFWRRGCFGVPTGSSDYLPRTTRV
jgi:hypothetical protein